MTRRVLVALTMLALPSIASAQTTTMSHKMPAPATRADTAYEASMQKMMSTMGSKPTGNADRDFVTMMLPHHVGAVDMAQVELKYGKDPELLDLARKIVAAQDEEITQMHAWQAKHPH